MRTYRCTCGNTLYFENYRCIACGRELGFLPDHRTLAALEPDGGETFRPLSDEFEAGLYRKCLHYQRDDACNWMVPDSDPEPY
ncbi:MAG: zinc-ribbon domain-containing protein, partial [Wenzhouxiangellaceae bacterium]|nr:zinc-ribbon domain-containing protein [Wenzhouxiangellaceae bacterium]